MSRTFVDVALPLASVGSLTYEVPDDLKDRAVPGARVVVPMRQREMVGVVVGVGRPEAALAARARPILAAPDPTPVLDATLLELASWTGAHYAAAPGLVLRAMLPAALFSEGVPIVRVTGELPAGAPPALASLLKGVRGERGVKLAQVRKAGGATAVRYVQRLAGLGRAELLTLPPRTAAPEKSERVIRLTGEPLTLGERDARFVRAPRQRQAYDVIESLGGSAAAEQLANANLPGSALRALIKAGLARAESVRRERDPFAAMAVSAPPGEPTPQQREAIAALESLDPGGVALLFGVTGSGKTLVYLDFLRRIVADGRSAIVLVPEIGLTPQTVARFRGVFGDQVAVLHSALSDGERYDAWCALREGRRKVAVGARSVIFAAVPDLGAIVVDEEHDASYKQADPAPRYHARQVAMRRAQIAGARLVLGSATPSLETWAAAESGAVRLIALPERIGARPLPRVDVVDLREAPLSGGPVAWSEALDRAVEGALARGEQAMLLLNRRGFSTFVQCPACGTVIECPNCSVALTYHHQPPTLRCHHCDHRERPPAACPSCGEAVQRFRGAGTQQVEDHVAARFPTARIARMDVDTTSGKWAHHRILADVAEHRVDILVGTQMIAKGLDFPNVTVVGVVDADVALNLPDFRSSERTFQLLTQVAGRAGRGPRGGRVLVQTRQPSHPAVACASRHDVAGFARAELEERRDPPYPPHSHLANLVLSGPKERAVGEAAVALADWLRALFDARSEARADLLGPAPCPIQRLRGRFRWHLLLREKESARLTRLVGYVAAHAPVPGSVRLVIDRDPVALL
jgi:primosomal protein N' (replication factor Y)